MKVWTVKRYIVEEYEVVAVDREQAKRIEPLNPCKITVKKETLKFKREI